VSAKEDLSASISASFLVMFCVLFQLDMNI
jgi:hypothetical protein